MIRTIAIAILVLSASGALSAQQQQISPCTSNQAPTGPLKSREGRIYMQARRGRQLPNSTNSNCNSRVAEHVTVKPGPIGELYLVNGLNDYIKVDSARLTTSVYPSLIFDMSASPMYRLNDNNDKKRKAINTKLDLLWRDVTVTLSASCKGEDQAVTDCSSQVSVLEVLPNQSSSGQKDS